MGTAVSEQKVHSKDTVTHVIFSFQYKQTQRNNYNTQTVYGNRNLLLTCRLYALVYIQRNARSE